MAVEPFTIVEIDVGRCANVFGTAPCTAALGGAVAAKCFNTFGTCEATVAFVPGVMTLRYTLPTPGAPLAPLTFPALVSVSADTSTVNIAGADDSMGAFGRRGSVEIELQDFLHHDRGIDLYQAERVTGAAQADGIGYTPESRGTHFGRLRARWPHYAGRACRVIEGYLVGGAVVNTVTRHYVLTGFTAPDSSGRVKLAAADVLNLADNDRAQCPKPGAGVLAAAIGTGDTALTLAPSGIGAQYPAAGRAVIGSEIVDYTRAGDLVTLTARAVSGSTLSTHAAADTFQPVWTAAGVRIDDALKDWLVNFAGVPSAFIPAAAWAAEVTRWAPDVRLWSDVCSPTGVNKLAGELAALGVSVWWDDAAQLVGLKVNRPPDGDTVWTLTEGDNLLSIEIMDRDEDRLTDLLFLTVQKDPTKSATDPANFLRAAWIQDTKAKRPEAYGDTKTRKVFCRWFNRGDDSAALTLGTRVLKRFSSAPARVKLTVSKNDRAIGLTDVLSLTSAGLQDKTGATPASLWQVISRKETADAVELLAQAYQWAGRYGFALVNTAPVWASASAAEKAVGEWACDATLKMPDGTPAYEAI
ncbi:hypothetical protein [Stagnihabitans tardus]|uniref:Uncharacterized protein n=1 Tax=Stagnihabitans tardus TaxID=2699202 RepID=A0AAE4YE02_9RHOB|nr:hypothetical protein [Stagnihabitans tardus]NBZ87915.1 hypothetical protein [Stagnihabitans tardus]